jgi:hypothetical protein
MSVHVPYVSAEMRTLAKVELAVTAQSTVRRDGSHGVPTIIDIDGLSLTPSKVGLLKATERKYEMLHFGYVAQWESFRGVVISQCFFLHDDSSLSKYFSNFVSHMLIVVPCGC